MLLFIVDYLICFSFSKFIFTYLFNFSAIEIFPVPDEGDVKTTAVSMEDADKVGIVDRVVRSLSRLYSP